MTYSFKDHSVILGSQEITGFSEDGVQIEFNGEGFTDTVGLDGEVATNLDANQSGTVTLNLLQSSSSNAYLSGLYQTAREGGQIAYPLVIRDQFGKTVYTCADAKVKRIPNTSRVRETGAVPWAIICGTLKGFEGGV